MMTPDFLFNEIILSSPDENATPKHLRGVPPQVMANEMARIDFYIRILLTAIWFFFAAFLTMLILPLRWRDPSLGALFARILKFGGHFFLGIKVHVYNKNRLYSAQPCIYVCNHQSNLDIVTLSGLFPTRTVIIGKKELFKLPFFGFLFYGTGNIMIDRKDRVNSIAGLNIAKNHILSEKVSVWIFPEGTRNRGSAHMLPFKKGAFHLAIAAQVPVVPIVHQHLFRYCEVSKNRLYHYKSKGSEIPIHVLEPVSTVGMTSEDLPKLMKMVREKMEAELAKPEMHSHKLKH